MYNNNQTKMTNKSRIIYMFIVNDEFQILET